MCLVERNARMEGEEEGRGRGANAILELATTEHDPEIVEYVVAAASLAADVHRGVRSLLSRSEGTPAQEIVAALVSPESIRVEVEVVVGGGDDERCALTGAFGVGQRRLRIDEKTFRVGYVGFQAAMKIVLFVHFLHSLVSFHHEDATKAAKDYSDARTLVYGLEFATPPSTAPRRLS